MTAPDEALAEAMHRYPPMTADWHTPAQDGEAAERREAFTAGAEWQASRDVAEAGSLTAEIDEKSAALSEFANALTLHKDKIDALTTQLGAAQATVAEALARGDNWDWAHTEDVKYSQAHLYHEMRAILSEAPTAQAVPLPDRETLRKAVGGVLWNATNYPRKAQPYLLGTDTAPLTAKVVDAVIARLVEQQRDPR